MSSRRAAAGSSARSGSNARKQALEELRRLREGGLQPHTTDESSSRIAQFKTQVESVYKTVSEHEYEELVRQRRQGLPFVENDDGEMGYYDDGEEQFFESEPEVDPNGGEYDEDDDDAKAGKKRSAGALSSSYARRAKKLQRAKLGGRGDQKITNMFFSASAAGSKTKSSAGSSGVGSGPRARKGAAAADLDLDSMLDDLTSNPTASRPMLAPRPMAYASGSSFTRSAGSSAKRPVAPVPRYNQHEDHDHQDDHHQEEDDHSFEPDAPQHDEDDDHAMETEGIKDEENQAPVENQNSPLKQEDTPTEKPEKPLSKRELLLRKARENRLQTTQPTARALAGLSEPAAPVAAPVPSSVPSSSTMLPGVPSNEVSEWWQVGNQDDVKMEDAEIKASDTDSAAVDAASSSTDALQMYWIDAVEVRDRPGKLYLIGKTKSPIDATFKSCCVVVNNIERYMYLVPRIPSDLLHEHEDPATTTLRDLDKARQQQMWMHIHEEIRKILIPSCISLRKDQDLFQTKLVERNYAFERADLPRGKHLYLKVKYSAKYPAPPQDICNHGGKFFSRICGAFTRPLETFLLKHKFLGPSWIQVQNPVKSKENVSFCQMEFETSDPKGITTLGGGFMAPPPLTVMSLSLKTFCNPTTGKHEVVTLSSITESNVSADGGAKNNQHRPKISHFTAIRPLDQNQSFPPAYLQAVQDDERFGKSNGSRREINTQHLRIELNERAMLSYFLTRVQMDDPDVIVGHNLHKYALDLLISRIDHFKLGGLWSKLTRLRRGRLHPLNVGEGWNEYRMDDLINGRLFCDTYVSAKELLTSQPSYSLSHLVSSLLQKQRLEVEMNDLPQILGGGPMHFVRLLRHTLDDAMFVLQLMHKLEVLPLSKQLATLCGYLWSRTLEANKRAERIEYLLLHEFNRSKHKFIVPEKFKNHQTKEPGGKRREKASYAGGMVFAPKKGLYDNFVVLLDFNSLYPSIIREYNICFTTVERRLEADEKPVKISRKAKKKEDEDDEMDDPELDDVVQASAGPQNDQDIPPLPSSTCDEGVLPQVIKRLLESRKQVKQQLKIETTNGNLEKAKQLDIRQRAIKLTANSMYGCLGFRYSRFYAKPIAALITSTGRQTLQRAKEVAEQECGYDVIYGDTDSIMVDSRSDQLDDAKRIGREIQVQCNKHFKLLELEVDYIFKAILLLNKKKYAALVIKERPNLNGPSIVTVEKEVKGLDLVRRDWCVVSKAVGNAILDFILSGASRDEVVENIHDYLGTVAERLRSGKEPIDQFVITKSLNKPPEQYPDKAKQYHVQVALALKHQGKPIGIGSHIPYVLCKEEEPGSGRRAYHPEEVKRSNGSLNIDIEWYLESQIHPPVNRLCAHIEGTSSPQLAHCLGLDTSKFAHSAHGPSGLEDPESQAIPSVLQSDADRFKDCTPLTITCKKCQQTNSFPGAFKAPESSNDRYVSGLVCPALDCRAEYWGYDQEGIYGQVGDDLIAILSNRLHLATRVATKRYYEGWVVCSDVTCKTRTQKQSLRGNGNICSSPGCRATVSMEFSDHALYTQLKYLESLFDVDRAIKKAHEQQARVASSMELPPLSERHRDILQLLLKQAEQAVRQNDYNWVKPSIWQTLFA